MSSVWQRRRAPDDVPTPVAVAVSDFCRRARAPASGAEVRDALSALAESDDFRVLQLAEQEPAASPLGPYALVDLVQGVPPEQAAERERCGYYALARELLALRATPDSDFEEDELDEPSSPRGANGSGRAPTAAELFPPASAKKGRGAKAAKIEPLTVAERIAPKKRGAEPPREEPFGVGGVHKGELAKPRGRFTRLETPSLSIQELEAPQGKETLQGLLEQHQHRFALLAAMVGHYVGRGGLDVTLGELDGALAQHGLRDKAESHERELVLGAYQEHRGATGRVAWALNIAPAELARLVHALGVAEDVENTRERFRREALAPRNWTARLDLLGRTKYLADLGITQRFTDTLRQELRQALKAQGGLKDPERTEAVARQLGVANELLSKALEKLSLASNNQEKTA